MAREEEEVQPGERCAARAVMVRVKSPARWSPAAIGAVRVGEPTTMRLGVLKDMPVTVLQRRPRDQRIAGTDNTARESDNTTGL